MPVCRVLSIFADMNSVRLEIMIPTFGPEGLKRVAAIDLPVVKDVRYLVSCQSEPLSLPQQLSARSDVEIHFIEGRGLSANRNALLDLASAPLLMFADDDVTLYADGISAAMCVMAENPDIDGACFQPLDKPHPYPDVSFVLKARTARRYYAMINEVVFRREALKRSGVRFSLLMGIGAPYLQSGEDDLFICRVLRKGLHIRYFPIVTYNHLHASTGYRTQTPGVLRSRGAVLSAIYPLTALPRMCRLAVMLPQPTLTSLKYMLQGALYAFTHKL